MTFSRVSVLLPLSATALVALMMVPACLAQGPTLDVPAPSAETAAAPVAASPVVIAQPSLEGQHEFWDTGNKLLFIGVAASNSADFAVTYSNLHRGGQELNPIVRIFGRSIGGLAANFAGETAGTIALSYFLHKSGHHKLERAVSMVNISSSAGAVTYGLTHR
jgi:hypothetical protein